MRYLFVTAVFLAGLFLAGVALPQPKPEPEPYEVITWKTVHETCGANSRFVDEKGRECISRLVAKMPSFDPKQRERFGRYYNPEKYLECRLNDPSWGNACGTRFTLQRRPAPEYWPYPGVPRPNIPSPELDKYYRKNIKPEEYFQALCKSVAGEFIFKTVEDVFGLYQIRPRVEAWDDEMEDPYVLEDPHGYSGNEGRGEPAYEFIRRDGFKFIEVPARAYAKQTVAQGANTNGSRVRETDKNYLRTRRESLRELGIVFEPTDALASRYGYTWREITGIRERDLGIAGGDLIVVDLKTGEVLGYKRGFSRSVITKKTLGGRNWRSTQDCPLIDVNQGKQGRHVTYWFVKKVLKPAPAKGADYGARK